LPQNSLDPSADRGLSDFNATHRLSLSFLYDLPFRRMWEQGPSWSRKLLDSWQAGGILSAQSGSPFTVVLPGSPAASAAAFGNPERPNLAGDPSKGGPVAGNPNCQATAQVGTPQNFFNQCAFAAPAPELFGPAFGTEGRNILTGPGFTNLDFSLSKSIPLHGENHRLQFRGEFFNLLNHPNFDVPGHTFNLAPCGLNDLCPAENFGSILSSNAYGNKPPRQIQLGIKYIF
jgi:hypothetical protein